MDIRLGPAAGAGIACTLALVASLISAPGSGAADGSARTTPAVTPAVALAAPASTFAGESIRLTVSATRGVVRTCMAQRARIGGAWKDLAAVTLDRRARGSAVVATTDWNLGRWSLRVRCGTQRSTPVTMTVQEPPPWTAAQISMTGVTPAYSPDVYDYVTRCTEPVSVDVVTPAGLRVAVDRSAADAGTFSRSVELQPNQAFTIRLLRGGQTRALSVRCLPSDFPALTVEGRGTADWYLSSVPFGAERTDYVFVLDSRGTPVWWIKDRDRPNTVRLWTSRELEGFGIDAPFAVSWFREGYPVLATADGRRKVIDIWLDRHDLQPTGRGTFLALRYQKRNCSTDPTECVDMTRYGGIANDTLEDGQVIEVDPTGRVLWRWSTRDHVAIEESGRWLKTTGLFNAHDGDKWDMVHLNTVDDLGSAVLITARHLDAVLKVDKESGRILWKLGGTTTPESLRIVGLSDPIPLGGPHDARVLPDGSVTVFDNGTAIQRPGRMLRFRIDEDARTATLLENITDPRAITSACCGSARRLSNGNWVSAYGGRTLNSEIQPFGNPIFTINTEERSWVYRIVPVENSSVSAEDWRAGMNAQHPR